MKKRLAIAIMCMALAASMSGCGTDNTTAGAAGRLNTEAMELAELPEQEAAAAGSDHELTEEPEAEIEGSLIADNEESASTGNADQKPAASQASVTGNTDSKNHSTSGNAATSTNTASNSGTQSSNAGSTSNTGNTSSAGTTAPAATTQEHVHTWVTHNATGHYEEQVVTAAWDEPVYESRAICNKCGADVTDDETRSMHVFECSGGWYVTSVQTGTIHHEAETAQVWVEDAPGYTECSGCGERSIAINHNH